MDKFLSVALGGIPKAWNDFRWFLGQASNQGIYQALNNLLGSYGSNVILQGCVVDLTVPAVATMTEGWIYLGGELLKVEANAGFDSTTVFFFAKVVTTDTTGDKTLKSLASASTYQKNRAVLNSASGSLRFDGARLGRVKAFTKAFDTTTFSGTGFTMMDLIPSATLDATNLRASFNCTLTAHAAGASPVLVTLSIKKDAVLEHVVELTIGNGNEKHDIALDTVITGYKAGEEIQVTAIHNATTEVVTLSNGILICEGWDG